MFIQARPVQDLVDFRRTNERAGAPPTAVHPSLPELVEAPAPALGTRPVSGGEGHGLIEKKTVLCSGAET